MEYATQQPQQEIENTKGWSEKACLCRAVPLNDTVIILRIAVDGHTAAVTVGITGDVAIDVRASIDDLEEIWSGERRNSCGFVYSGGKVGDVIPIASG